MYVPERFSFRRPQFQGKSYHLSDDGGGHAGIVALGSPRDSPLVDDEDAHVAKSAEEEDLLG